MIAVVQLTLDDVWQLVGPPAKPGAIYSRSHETGALYGWEDEWCGTSGWSWAVTRGDIVVHHGWTAGNRVDCDRELDAAIAKLQHVVAQPRGAA